MNINTQTFLLTLIFFAITLCPVFAQGKTARIEGIVLSAEGPLKDAAVYAYPDFSSLAEDANGFESMEGEKQGQFRLELPTGSQFCAYFRF